MASLKPPSLKPPSHIEETFALQIKGLKFPEPVREFVFAPERRYRADFAWPACRILVELDGGLYMAKSGHNTLRAIERDMEKANLAQALGYRLFRFSSRMVKDGTAIAFMERML
jgi:very-short-patch-repair endonuclease